MYTVRRWKDDRVVDKVKGLAAAKRICRSCGHTGEALDNGQYPHHCWVADVGDWLVYNPVFRVGKDDHLKREEPA